MLEIGYSEVFLKRKPAFHVIYTIFPIFNDSFGNCLAMVSLRRYDGLKFFILGFIISIVIYYFKDFSLALGKTDRIPIVLAIWSPVLALSLFTLIGVLQINEK